MNQMSIPDLQRLVTQVKLQYRLAPFFTLCWLVFGVFGVINPWLAALGMTVSLLCAAFQRFIIRASQQEIASREQVSDDIR